MRKEVVLSGLNIDHNPECYIEILQSILSYKGLDGYGLANHFLSFVYKDSKSAEEVNDDYIVQAFLENNIEDRIRELAGVEINHFEDADWDEFCLRVESELSSNNPVICMVDTFFMEQFPKKNGHNIHALMIYGQSSQGFHVKSAMPGDWVLNPDKFKLAVCSVSDKFNTRYHRVMVGTNCAFSDFDYENTKRLNYLSMKGLLNKKGVSSGIEGVKYFYSQLLSHYLEQNKEYYLKLFKDVSFVVHQRKRFHNFLKKYEADSQLIETYGKASHAWEVFRNMCYKMASEIDQSIGERVLVKLRNIVELEELGLRKLGAALKNV